MTSFEVPKSATLAGAGREQYVVGLEVAVHDLELVQVRHPAGHLRRDPDLDPPAQRPAGVGQHVRERPERHELGHQERSVVRQRAGAVEDQQAGVPDLYREG